MAPGPTSSKEAAFRILVDELGPLFDRLESIDRSMKVTGADLNAAASALSELSERPIPKQANPFAIGVAAGLSAGLAVAIFAVGICWFASSHLQEQARVGRAVLAAFPSLDPPTQAKLQAAINKTGQ